jgi:hypothetical protein
MRWVTEYRRFADEYRRLAAVLTKPADRRALELLAKGWDRSADEREAKLRSGGDQGDTRRSNGYNSTGRILVCIYITNLDMTHDRELKLAPDILSTAPNEMAEPLR